MEITLSPEDNLMLANLCGPLDENIRQLANGLDIDINRRGSTFYLSGTQTNMRLGVQMLENFYARSKKPIELEDIQLGLVEIDKLKPEEVTSSSMPTLMTRRGDLHGRTPRLVDTF